MYTQQRMCSRRKWTRVTKETTCLQESTDDACILQPSSLLISESYQVSQMLKASISPCPLPMLPKATAPVSHVVKGMVTQPAPLHRSLYCYFPANGSACITIVKRKIIIYQCMNFERCFVQWHALYQLRKVKSPRHSRANSYVHMRKQVQPRLGGESSTQRMITRTYRW